MSDKRIEVRIDGYTRVCLTVIAVLLTVTVVGLWVQAAPSAPAAWGASGSGSGEAGGFGSLGERIAAQLEAANKTNAKLDELIRVLQSGQVKVQLVKPDDKSSGGANATSHK